MSEDHRFTAPWERSLSRIRGERPPRGDAPRASGRPHSDQPEENARGRRRRADEAPHSGRLTVADLIARVGHPGDIAASDPSRPSRSRRAADEPPGESAVDGPTLLPPSARTDAGPARDKPGDESTEPPESEDRSHPGGGLEAGSEHSGGDNAGGVDAGDDADEPEAAPGSPPPDGPTGSDPPTGPDGPDRDPDDGKPDDGDDDGDGDGDDRTRNSAKPDSWLRSALPLHIPGHGHVAAVRNKPANYWLRASHISIALASVLVLLATGIVWSYLRVTDSQYTRISALDENSSDVRNPDGQYGDENYLIVGVDTRAGENADVGAGSTDDAAGARSDTVILVNIPADRSRVVAVSFPRDLNIDRPSCDVWDNGAAEYTDEMAYAENDVKLNSAYAVGGPRCLVKVVQKLSGLKVNHFIGMDFAGFESMVDTVGGVQVCATRPLVDDELGTILPTTGMQTISGKTALEYVRARKVEAEGNGDYGRIKRQQVFLSSLLRNALSTQVLLDPGKLNSFINDFTKASFGDNLDTQALITLGRSLQGVAADEVTFLTTPTAGTDDWGNEIPRVTDIRNIFDAIIDDQPLPGEQPADDSGDSDSGDSDSDSDSGEAAPPAASETHQVHAMSPGSVSVQVSNASNVSGFASSIADQLGSQGFQIYSIGNHTAPVPSTIVQFSGDNEAAAATVASAVPGARLQRISGMGNIVEVLLSDSSPSTVATPEAPGSVLHPVLASDSNKPGSVPLDVNAVNAGNVTCE